MGSVALDLKSEREKKKISLSQIAADTRISLRYLQSIEEGRYSDLPGGIYNRAFLKAYCESINLDPGEILERYDSQISLPQSEKNLKNKTPFPSRQNSFSISGPILIWSIMLLISAIGLYFSRGWISEVFSPYFHKKNITEVRYETPEESSTDPSDASPALNNSSIPESTEPLKSTGGISPIPTESVDPVAENSLPAATEPVLPETSVEPKLRLKIAANEQCWIAIDRDGIPSARKLMEPGETQIFDAVERFHILLGNAGGVLMKINDKPTKPLGNSGEVIRLDINLKNLQQFIDQSAG